MNRWTGPGIFVAVVWLAAVAAAFFYVARFTSCEPFGDEWDLIPGVVGQERLSRWLWAQHNEHRLPLPKAIYFVAMKVSGYDARAGSVLTVLGLAGLSLGFVVAARRVRGCVEYADAFFPIALLNWGHFENFLIGFQFGFVLSAGLACAWCLLMMRGQAHFAAWMLPLLALCGAHGIVYVPPLAVASILLNRRTWPPAVLSVGLVVAYFMAYRSPAEHPPSAGVGPSVVVAGQVLSLGWGWIAQMTWPASAALTASFLLASILLIGHIAYWQPDDRRDLLIWLAPAAGTLALAVGIGFGRSGFGPLAGFADRYALIAFPIVGVGYLLWLRHGGRVGASLVPMAMFVVACLAATQHTRTGLDEGRKNAALMAEFSADLAAGLPARAIAERHPAVFPVAERLQLRIDALGRAGVSRYRRTIVARDGL